MALMDHYSAPYAVIQFAGCWGEKTGLAPVFSFSGVLYRGPGQCRHTYTSQLLTTGAAFIDWIAEQIGHTNGDMIRQHYRTRINEDGPDVVGILQHALNLQPAPP